MGPCAFQLHRIEVVQARPSRLYGDGVGCFAPESPAPAVPVLCLFGRTADGSSVCARIRNVYPYFYAELPAPLQADREALCRIGAAVGCSLAGAPGAARSPLHRLELVQARLMYHYDRHPRAFLKLSLYNQHHVKAAAEAFQTGRVTRQPVRCYEAHIPFALQFMMDHNLAGMGTVRLAHASTPPDTLSGCDIEVECCASQILNRAALGRFAGLRADAAGPFPSLHVLPSVVAMLEGLGLGTAAASQRPPCADGVALMDCLEKHRAAVQATFAASPAAGDPATEALPKAHEIAEAAPQPLQAPSSLWDGFPLSSTWDGVSLMGDGAPLMGDDGVPPMGDGAPPMGDDVSFSFGSQPASAGLAAELGPLPSEAGDDGREVESILEEMLRADHPGDMDLGQVDGAFDLGNMWSDNSYEADSLLGAPEFSSDGEEPARVYQHVGIPPTTRQLLESLRRHKLPRQVHQGPFEAAEAVVMPRGRGCIRITPASDPPLSHRAAVEWLRTRAAPPRAAAPEQASMSQIEGPTQRPVAAQGAGALPPSQLPSDENLSVLSLEGFGDSRGQLLSDPEHDEVLMVCWHFASFIGGRDLSLSGTIAQRCALRRPDVRLVADEGGLFRALIQTVNDLDPDILAGFEIEGGSWGYLLERGKRIGVHLARSVSRLLAKRSQGTGHPESVDPFAAKRTSTFQVPGRICLNIWRVLMAELVLRSYSFESVALAVLLRNYPRYRQPLLRLYFHGDPAAHRPARPDLVARYFGARAKANVELLLRTDVLSRACEFARLFGIELFSVVSRGSQFKVESLMVRLAHLDNFLCFSPSRPDVARMRAPECLPLIMEPVSGFYVDPVVVLDFQALYPSIIIAYNYCFTTCLGSATAAFPRVMGANFLLASAQDLHVESLEHVTVAPNRVAFVRREVREGVLPKMLAELLAARIAVKAELAQETDPVRSHAHSSLTGVEAAQGAGREAAGPQVPVERDLRLHVRLLLRPHAVHRGGRQHRRDRQGHLGARRPLDRVRPALGGQGRVRRHGQPLCPAPGQDAGGGARDRAGDCRGGDGALPGAAEAPGGQGVHAVLPHVQEALRRLQVREAGRRRARL